MTAVDGAALRRRWDEACASADAAVRQARTAAQQRGEDWLVRWFTNEISQLATLQAMVNGKRLRPGAVASGLFHDFPPDLSEHPYQAALIALEKVEHLFGSGLGAPEWDWSAGFPAGWPTSVRDRVRSYLPLHRT